MRRGRRRRRFRLSPLAVAAAVAVVVGAALAVWQLRGVRASPAAAASALAVALGEDRLAGVRFANTSSAAASAAWRRLRAGMAGATVSVSAGGATSRGSVGIARLRWLWRLPFGRRWAYKSSVSLRYRDGAWSAVWAPGLVNSRLGKGEVLQLLVRQPPRAAILAADGAPIVLPRPVVNVGIEPKRVRDLPLLLRRLHALLGVRPAPLRKAVRAAAPAAFVPVISLRRSQYEQLRAKLYPLPGTVFTSAMLPLAPTRAFARSLLGVVGEATAEIVKSSHGRVAAKEIVGLSGLEQAYDARLAGSPGLVVQAVRARGGAPTTLYAVAGAPGRPLRTTLEIPAQEAADRALAAVKQTSALVAVRISSGSLIAVAVGPDPGGFDIALQGEYPPGSTFKIATALALLERGEQPTSRVDCPATLTVNGKQFHNAEHEILGPATFAQDFAHSCNTAFASLAPRVAGDALPAAARALGIGRSLQLGLASFAGSVPVPRDPVELAAEAFGQGRILVSPLVLADAAAAAARGRWLPPRLLLDPPLPRPPPGPLLPSGPATTLRTLMRAVITTGTGTALANQPGTPVYGKTGSAETGTGNPPRTDAWFIGYQDDIAFAALVANSNGPGGTLAAPIISHFLNQIRRH